MKKISPKRFIAMLLTLSLCFGVKATAFAQVAPENVEVASKEETSVTPRTMETLVVKKGIAFQGIITQDVTPTRGRNLKMIFDNKGQSVVVMVTKKGSVTPLKTLTISASGTNTYDLINNCDGGTYTVYFDSAAGVISYMLVQTEYT